MNSIYKDYVYSKTVDVLYGLTDFIVLYLQSETATNSQRRSMWFDRLHNSKFAEWSGPSNIHLSLG